MRRSPSLLLVAVLSLVAGCAESALIRSSPEGADVYVNNQLIGTTPVTFTVPRSELADSYELKIEKDGYEPYVGTMPTRIAGGRATAAVFTLGIVYAFKSPRYIAAPHAVPLRPSLEAEVDRRLGKELRELNRRLAEREITQEQFEQQRKQLLGDK